MRFNRMDKFLVGFTACVVVVGLMAATSGNIQWTQIASGSRHGTATKGQSSDGTGTSGNCAKFDVSGNIVDAGIACASGAGSPLTTKGDLYTFSTVNNRLPVGTNGQVVYANSGATNGIDWEAPISLTTTGSSGAATYTPGNPNVLNIPQYSGGAGTFTPVGTVTCSGSAVCTTGTGSAVVTTAGTTITFASIPGTFNNLQLVVCARTNRAAVNDNILIGLNGDSSTNYNLIEAYATGGSNVAGTLTNGTTPSVDGVSGNNATASRQGCFTSVIASYTLTTFQKLISTVGVYDAGISGLQSYTVAANWTNTAAVTSIALTPKTGPNFAVGSSAYLYGY